MPYSYGSLSKRHNFLRESERKRVNILHKVPGFILAELPLFEDGVKHFLSVTPSQVMLHRIVQGAETVTQEMNLPLIRAILQAADSLLP